MSPSQYVQQLRSPGKLSISVKIPTDSARFKNVSKPPLPSRNATATVTGHLTSVDRQNDSTALADVFHLQFETAVYFPRLPGVTATAQSPSADSPTANGDWRTSFDSSPVREKGKKRARND
ncbi:hypothetical protein BN946_scf184952.g7 [Trametes cinnabarina]|uniref:Uncharacterized protein n=1 Tax=Pycnoporus cinnabarinus TaxID=5643 RepID=A0A060SU57_PYCCI|nr:hypothetical protein BN946_scf184952.g7 [Trametes cinnabarina]